MVNREFRPFHPGDVAASVRVGELVPSGSGITLVEWVDEGNADGERNLIAPLHVHWEDDETWYVLDGQLCVLLDDRVATLDPGGAATAVHGTRHTFWNPNPQPCRYLIATTPRVLRLIDALHHGGGTDPAEVFRNHASEFLGWQLPSPLRPAS